MAKSRGHGQGALYWNPGRETWRAVIDVGFNPANGRRRQMARESKTREGAVKKLNQMLREQAELGLVVDRSTRVSEIAAAWLADVSGRSKPHTLAGYRSNVKINILPSIGTRIAADLTPADIRRMHAAIRNRGVGDSTIASAHRTLVSLLEYARSERVLAQNVATLTPPRRARMTSARASLSRDEAKALLAIEDPRWTLALLTGLRSGEARALRWSDVDLEDGVAELSWSLTEGTFAHGCGGSCGKKIAGACPVRRLDVASDLEWIALQGRYLLVRPKNGAARQIPLTGTAVGQLRAHADADLGPNPHDLVWHRLDGSPQTNTDDNDQLRAALRLANIDRPAATTHWLRHSYVTLSEHAGIAWAAYSGVSGHSSPEASDPYRHTLTDEGRRAVETLAGWVQPGGREEGATSTRGPSDP